MASAPERALNGLYRFFTNYYVNRVLQMVLTLYVVVTFGFILMRMLPGGPAAAILSHVRNRVRKEGGRVDREKLERIVEAYMNVRPDQSLLEQYLYYMNSWLHMDFGTSFWYSRPVIDIIREALPWSMFLSSVTALIGMATGIMLGVLMAYYEGSNFDIGLTMWTIFSASVPNYVAAILFIYVFVYQFGIFPNGGQMTPSTTIGYNWPFIAGVLKHAALPMAAFILTGFGAGLGMRANCIRILGEDYLRVARLRGLSSYRIAMRYVGRNAIMPIYTGIMMSLAGFFSSSVIIEQIFKYPGMGYYLFQAVVSRDYPLMLGGFIMLTTITLLGILVADFTYGFIDPRASSGERRESYGGAGSARALVRSMKMLVTGNQDTIDDEDAWDSFEERRRQAQSGERGETTPLDFTVDADAEESTTDRVYRLFDTYVYAPFMVIWSDIRGKVSLTLMTIYILMGTVGVMVVGRPTSNEGPMLVPPFQDWQYPLGTDQMGQDLLALMVHATPAMFQMILAGALLSTGVGALLGILSGFRGGWFDRGVMFCSDVIMTIPGLPLILVLAAIFSPDSPWMVGVLLSVNNWGGTARQIRSQVLSLREREYIEASRAMGLSTATILLKDIFPNLAPYILIKAVNAGKNIIYGSVGLYFLGILPFSTLNWGVVLNMAYSSGTALLTWSSAHWLLVPMFTIVGLSVGMILLTQAAEQLTNPRVRARHAKTVDEDKAAEAAQSAA